MCSQPKSLVFIVCSSRLQYTELTHYALRKYMRAFASLHGLNSNDDHPDLAYNTRVERVEKRFDAVGRREGWRLTLKELVQTGGAASRATWWTEARVL